MAVSARSNIPAPFVGYYSFDEFGNMKSRSGHYALNQDTFDNATFVNNRRIATGWSYDADGRLTASKDTNTSSTQTWTYDAKGDPTTITETITATTTTTTTNTLRYDGDGDLLFELVSSPFETKSDYLINSTVLGTVLTKLDANGNKDITYVPANGLVYPMQTKDFNGNPVIKSVIRDASGLQEDDTAIDPFGARIRNVQPPNSSQQMANMHVFGPDYGGYGLSRFTNANNLSTGCMLDGARASCGNVLGALSRGMATGVISYNGSAASIVNLIGFMPMNNSTRRFVGPGNKTYYDDKGHPYQAYGTGHFETTLSTEFVPIFGYDLSAPLGPQRRAIDNVSNKHDCYAMASEVAKIANASNLHLVGNKGTDIIQDFMDKLARRFTEFNSATEVGIAAAYVGITSNYDHDEFADVGFKEEFQDHTGPGATPNQVRHTIGGLIIGYVGGNNAITRKGMDWREDMKTPSGQADTRLNRVTMPMGELLSGRADQAGLRATTLADWIRTTLCNPIRKT